MYILFLLLFFLFVNFKGIFILLDNIIWRKKYIPWDCIATDWLQVRLANLPTLSDSIDHKHGWSLHEWIISVMQAHFLLGPIPIPISSASSAIGFYSSLIADSLPRTYSCNPNSKSTLPLPRSNSIVSSWSAAIDGHRNHYELLGVPPAASSKEIKKAFRLLARKVTLILCSHQSLGIQLQGCWMENFMLDSW